MKEKNAEGGRGGVGEGMTSMSVLIHQFLKHRICITCFLKPDGKKISPYVFFPEICLLEDMMMVPLQESYQGSWAESRNR